MRKTPLLVFGAFLLAACAEPPVTPPPALRAAGTVANASGGSRSYVIVAKGTTVSPSLTAGIVAAGGTITSALTNIGVAVVSSSDVDFATRVAALGDVESVVEDVMLDYELPAVGGEIEAGETADAAPASHFGANDSFRLIQWAPDAISAPAAWHAGHIGTGARVAILDGGVYSRHVDIAPGLDTARSRSFVPGQPYNFDTGTFWHGTHVAGIVAARAQGIGTVGIAPGATIIGVKVLHGSGGLFSWVIEGIYYAATPIAEGGAGAHIINMSLGAHVPRGAPFSFLHNALNRATSYANKRGVTVIASAGNAGLDLDHTANLIHVPSQSVGVLSVSATGPLGWALGATNFDRPASYTNYGQRAIAFAGPGGDSALPGNQPCTKPRIPTGSITVPCWVFDLVMAPCRGGPTSTTTYCWASGTSMSSPAVAGVAALIIGKNGGPMQPAQLEAALRRSADDLGKPGNDDFYGQGRVNAWRAVQ